MTRVGIKPGTFLLIAGYLFHCTIMAQMYNRGPRKNRECIIPILLCIITNIHSSFDSSLHIGNRFELSFILQDCSQVSPVVVVVVVTAFSTVVVDVVGAAVVVVDVLGLTVVEIVDVVGAKVVDVVVNVVVVDVVVDVDGV